jgi:uncharacterized protein YwgA
MAMPADVVRLIRLNGGRLIGKTRLQKTAYFLETSGAGFGFDFSYHHYGPYSEELAAVTDDAKALRMLSIEWRTSQDGAEYAIFADTGGELGRNDEPEDAQRSKILHLLEGYSTVELELAATADFLATHGYGNEAWAETRRRKGSKVTAQRRTRAEQLLEALDRI